MRLKNRTKASAGAGAGRAGQRREGGKGPVSRGPWYHPRRDASRQCALSPQHPLVQAAAPVFARPKG